MLLADVGMLGMPNAGNRPLFARYRRLNRKWRIIRFHSGAKSGCGTNGQRKELRCSDIPGLIEGAAEGAGLGIRF